MPILRIVAVTLGLPLLLGGTSAAWAATTLESGHPVVWWSAANWSGYVVTDTAPYTRVTGEWVVPRIANTLEPTASAAWIGIGGWSGNGLIQAGTSQNVRADGHAHFDAWWEILPATATVIPGFVVKPGDQMFASIVQNSHGQWWTISLDNLTTGQLFSTVQRYHGLETSAEWVLEMPTPALAHYGQRQ